MVIIYTSDNVDPSPSPSSDTDSEQLSSNYTADRSDSEGSPNLLVPGLVKRLIFLSGLRPPGPLGCWGAQDCRVLQAIPEPPPQPCVFQRTGAPRVILATSTDSA
ncbi:hypothetical protein RRG08_020210 [Elysia crispata]|uniref:Uncharacterized protein n=1 Tax=Elysia crispata TaxID=231223 RepID=A0AAE1DRQ7_9GAST|nr:hypothetical protein RRG08_020210 [Elysia crispata]